MCTSNAQVTKWRELHNIFIQGFVLDTLDIGINNILTPLSLFILPTTSHTHLAHKRLAFDKKILLYFWSVNYRLLA